jgi:hypothetical protein
MANRKGDYINVIIKKVKIHRHPGVLIFYFYY